MWSMEYRTLLRVYSTTKNVIGKVLAKTSGG